jgi:hypothetical protein
MAQASPVGTTIKSGKSLFPIIQHQPQHVAFRWSKVEFNLPALENVSVLMGATHIAQNDGNFANQILVGQQVKAKHRKRGKNREVKDC